MTPGAAMDDTVGFATVNYVAFDVDRPTAVRYLDGEVESRNRCWHSGQNIPCERNAWRKRTGARDFAPAVRSGSAARGQGRRIRSLSGATRESETWGEMSKWSA